MMRRMLRWRRALSAGTGAMGRAGPALPGLPGRLFRGAPLVAWLAAWALNDLRQPEGRLRMLVRRLRGKAGEPRLRVVSVEPPAALEGPDAREQSKRK
jgi:hypothetical protein